MRAITTLIRDLTGLSGVGCITYGAYLYSVQAAFVVGGILLLAIAILTAIGGEKPPTIS